MTGEEAVMGGAGGRPILERMRLDGRRALVTGGGQGIGRAFAHALGEAGARVAVIDLDAARADAVAAELTAKGVDAFGLGVDVAADGAAQAYVSAVVERFGGLEIAVNNAGVNRNSAAEETTPEEWDDVFRLNTRAVFLGCQAEARVMLAAGYGKIVNTASMASLIVPHPQKQAAYNASKAAVATLTRTLGTEWVDRGVRVNCISPGIIRTALIDGNDALAPLVKEWLTQIPAGCLGEVTDLQAAIVYLAGEASDFMTGHNLVIDGGQTVW
jgi:NAD(P)-dependent dehydrogenase (short-subunit alcohol dehydrogenase family)